MSWRRTCCRSLSRPGGWVVRTRLPAFGLSTEDLIVVAVGLASLLLAGGNYYAVVAFSLAAFALTTVWVEFWRGMRVRQAMLGEFAPTALSRLIGKNRRRYGGYVVHAAVVLLAIGIAGSSAYDSVVEGRLSPGESLAVGGYTVTLRGVTERQAANATEVRAVLDVSRGGKGFEAVKRATLVKVIPPPIELEIGRAHV